MDTDTVTTATPRLSCPAQSVRYAWYAWYAWLARFIRRISSLPVLFLALLAVTATAAATQGEQDTLPMEFNVRRTDDLVRTEAWIDLPVSQAVVWQVLTDYERYPRFISSMRQSRIVSRDADGILVEQKGRFGFLFFSQDVNVHLRVSESPETVVEAHVVDGDLRVMDGRYVLTAMGDHVRLSYSGRLTPKFALPPLFGLAIVRHILLTNFKELVGEILRRGVATTTVSTVEPVPRG